MPFIPYNKYYNLKNVPFNNLSNIIKKLVFGEKENLIAPIDLLGYKDLSWIGEDLIYYASNSSL